MTFTPKQIEALEAPLLRSHVKERKQAGRQLSYIEGWVTIAEANRIFGFDAWDRETVSLIETNRELVELQNDRGERYQQWRVGYLAKVRIRVGEVIREGTGFGSGMARPEALGDAVESAAKEAETDAMKRALMTFGNPFGLALYDKTQANVEDTRPNAPPSPREPAPAPSGVKRLTSSRAKEIGLHERLKGLVEGAKDAAALDMIEERFDSLTAEYPLSWIDAARNSILLRREELAGEQANAALDAEYAAVVG
jgi:DNA repair and recombination protein RAD52